MAFPFVPCKSIIALVTECTIPDNRQNNPKKLVSCVQNNFHNNGQFTAALPRPLQKRIPTGAS